MICCIFGVLWAILVLCMSIGGVAKNYFHLSQCSKFYPLNPYSPCTAQYTVQVVWCYPCFPRAVQHSTGARRGPPPCAQLLRGRGAGRCGQSVGCSQAGRAHLHTRHCVPLWTSEIIRLYRFQVAAEPSSEQGECWLARTAARQWSPPEPELWLSHAAATCRKQVPVKLSRAELSTDYADWSLVSSGSGVISSSSASSVIVTSQT